MITSCIRVYRLALELNVPSRVVLERARRLGFGVPNQLSTLDQDQRAAVEKDLRHLPPDDPPAGVASKLRPRGPGSGSASQSEPRIEEET
jgi:hypothetical protein